MNIAGFNMDPLKAVLLPRFHHQLIPNKVYVEHDFPEDVIAALQQVGHVVEVLDDSDSLGSVQVECYKETIMIEGDLDGK